MKQKAVVETTLPQHIVIGPFYINVDSIKNALAKKHKDVATALMDFLAGKLRKDADTVSKGTLTDCNTVFVWLMVVLLGLIALF